MIIINVKNYGKIELELDYKNAPNTCANFVSLARCNFYNGLTFHRVIKGFMIQGGCPIGNGTGDPNYTIKGEFKHNGFNNELSHKRGVISMARAMNKDSAGSQFFIMHKDGEFLDGDYAAFGKVIEGIDAIARVRTSPSDRPYEPVVIESIEVIDEPDNKVEKLEK